MELIVTIPRKVQAKYLYCYIQPRYWEDSDINGEEDDVNGTLFKKFFSHYLMSSEMMINLGLPERYANDFFRIVIDLDNGCVIDWPEGISAEFGYKSCDMNVFALLDKDHNIIYETPEGETEYVIGPKFMNDYEDYFVLKVNEDGTIKNWNSKAMIEYLQHWTNSEK